MNLAYIWLNLARRGGSCTVMTSAHSVTIMSTQKGHKRKRSIQDTPVDLTKMQLARQRLSALQEELSGIEETETEMEEIMKHVDALQGILGSAKKLVS